MADSREIPFERACIGADEIEAVGRAMRAGETAPGGPVCERVERSVAALTGASFALLTPDLCSAVDLALASLAIGSGDDVVLSTLASPRIANAVMARGARPVFCDVDTATSNLDPADVERRITPATRLVVASHMDGVASDLAALRSLTEAHGCALAEDAMAGVGASWMGRHVGSLGDVGWISFADGMNLSAGEGAAFLTSDPRRFARAIAHRAPGRFISAGSNAIAAPSWNGPGGGYTLSDLLAALLEAQLTRLHEITRYRKRAWDCYREGLADLDATRGGALRLPVVPDQAAGNYHAYTLHTRVPTLRDALRKELANAGIETRIRAEPLHLSSYARRVLGPQPTLPGAEDVVERALQLPLFVGVSKRQIEHVVGEVRHVVAGGAALPVRKSESPPSGVLPAT